MTQNMQSLATLKIISLAIAFSTLTLLAASYFMNSQIMGGPGLFQFYILPGMEAMTGVVALMAVPAALLSVVIPKFLDKTPVDPLKPHRTGGNIVFYNWDNYKPIMFTTTLVRLALSESIAIYGFMISIFNHTLMNMIPFVGVALYLQFLWSPFFKRNNTL